MKFPRVYNRVISYQRKSGIGKIAQINSVISDRLSVISSDKSDRSDGIKMAGHTASWSEGWDDWLGGSFQLGEHGMPVSPRE
jgi:hypothetical protein